jgi:hypothetical protein
MQKRHTTLDYSIVTQVILLRPKAETTDHALATFFKADRLENCPAVGRRPLGSLATDTTDLTVDYKDPLSGPRAAV